VYHSPWLNSPDNPKIKPAKMQERDIHSIAAARISQPPDYTAALQRKA